MEPLVGNAVVMIWNFVTTLVSIPLASFLTMRQLFVATSKERYITFIEKREHESAIEFTTDLYYVDCVKRMYGIGSKEYQISQQRAELIRACEFVYLSLHPQLAHWTGLYRGIERTWNRLKMEGFGEVAAGLNGAMQNVLGSHGGSCNWSSWYCLGCRLGGNKQK
ncbi:hypothetical protein LSM04_001965 [Trypanosoma melophagium]|uniref:uncharacterized protein n=1 Tax=Trypanosoma melophagium TaxID=715481 RepID=UPI00351AB0CD|nr:hypothetical protein LSM04_001965 [Trypanosoma melophagium]